MMIELREALQIVLDSVQPLGTEQVELSDALVMVEQTETAGESAIRFTGEHTLDHISRRAADVKAGQLILPKGSRIGPAHVAVLASFGHVRPLVARRPRVAVMASGDELVRPTVRPGPSQIRNSNGPQLVAQLAALGLHAHDCGIVKDIAADIDRVLKAALAAHDVVIVSGGVSVGDFDLVPEVLRRNNVKLRFEKIAVKPGKPTVFGLTEQAYCFGLPGNPVSTFVVFELLVKPFLYRLMGYEDTPVHVRMRLEGPLTRKDTDRQSWIPVKMTGEEAVEAVEYHGSAHIPALCEADGLIAMDIGVAELSQGAPVRVRLL
jgi:molybdopterin molybdotransferase